MGLQLSSMGTIAGPAKDIIGIFSNVGVEWAVIESIAAAPLGTIFINSICGIGIYFYGHWANYNCIYFSICDI